jgi:SH3-like domain-containing protein
VLSRIWCAKPGVAAAAALIFLALALALDLDLGPLAAQQGATFEPRFLSLRADRVNARTGPGMRYPITWVYRRHGLPVEAIAQFEDWYRIRDADGDEGWIHRRLLSNARTALIVAGGVLDVRRRPSADSQTILRAESGVQGDLIACQAAWCQVDLGGAQGWLPRSALWGVYAREDFE